MRFNEKELVFLSRQPSEKAAELGMRGPKKGDGNTFIIEPMKLQLNVSQAAYIAKIGSIKE